MRRLRQGSLRVSSSDMITTDSRPLDSYDLDASNVALRDQLVFVMRGGMVKRFHNGATLQENTVAHHSWGVAWFCYLLANGNPTTNLLLSAMAHDMAEQITGDVPAPAKRLLGLRPLLHRKENEVLGQFGFEFEYALDEREKKILALSDCFDGMLYCIRERQMGNRFMDYTFAKFHSYVANDVETSTDRDVLKNLVQMFEDASGGPFAEQS
jgi:5'-deoxynucleotidase YfbR-like HD superfamily hydrolase